MSKTNTAFSKPKCILAIHFHICNKIPSWFKRNEYNFRGCIMGI